MELKGKKILIVGFGRSGQAAARYCLEQGAMVTVTDLRSAEELKKEDGRWKMGENPPSPFFLLPSSAFYFGSNPVHLFEEADIIVASPGVPLTLEGIVVAKKKGIPVVCEMELAEFDAKVIAITGTNGKSTVTTLIGEMLKEDGKRALVGGNLGTPLLELLNESKEGRRKPFDKLRAQQEAGKIDFVVLEVSSYQLDTSPSFHPHVALLLNITPDHLDRYANYNGYIASKALITANQNKGDILIYNEEDPLVAKIGNGAKARKIGFSGKDVVPKIDLSRAKITGQHNRENIIAASLAAAAVGCSAKAIQKVIDTFSGLPHRNQFVREIGGVKFYDDSKGTNVGAVVKSLEGFDSKVVLIAGGLDKGGSYEPLRPLVKDKVKALVLIGAAQKIIAAALGDLTEVVMSKDMQGAVREAYSRATKGDVVLLSPACASFDMFKDYSDRGNRFVEEVNKLKL